MLFTLNLHAPQLLDYLLLWIHEERNLVFVYVKILESRDLGVMTAINNPKVIARHLIAMMVVRVCVGGISSDSVMLRNRRTPSSCDAVQ